MNPIETKYQAISISIEQEKYDELERLRAISGHGDAIGSVEGFVQFLIDSYIKENNEHLSRKQSEYKTPVFFANSDCICRIETKWEDSLEKFTERVIDAVGIAKEIYIWPYRFNGVNYLSFDIKNETEWFSLVIQPIGITDLLPNDFLGDVFVQDWVDAHYLCGVLIERLGFSTVSVNALNPSMPFSKSE